MVIKWCLFKLTNIRVEQGFCGICYQACDVPATFTGPPHKFLISIETADETTIDKDCLTDFIQIPCATDQQSSSQLLSDAATGCTSKICGAAFSAVSTAGTPAPVYSKYSGVMMKEDTLSPAKLQ